MAEFTEFAEALLDQISVEIDEEKEIAKLSEKINDDPEFPNQFTELESFSREIFPEISRKVKDFTGFTVKPNLRVEFPELKEFKLLKGKKVFATKQSRDFVDELFSAVSDLDIKRIAGLVEKDTEKFLVYSTYAKSYISKISTTYGDYLDSCVYLNKFILSSYPKIILYKQGQPYDLRKDQVESGYKGALKMTMVEEIVHSTQDNLQNENKNAATNVNSINEELARIILNLKVNDANNLYDYLQLQTVPDDFPIAKRANLFFMLNPDNFVVNVLGPDVMTYSHVEIDPKISEIVPELSDIYQRWLLPIQAHHAAFSTMEGMAEFSVQNILQDDDDFQNYLTTFMGTDFSSYKVRKNMGKELAEKVYQKFGKDAFRFLIEKPPSTRELKDPELYLKRDLSTGSKHM
ncbi:MAG: hypothetical protein H8E89_02980 [Candidatus Nitrosopelagicus sp.]|nr:hypothetical protein [Candidatus Nitrosopelagicus sp.]